MNQACSFCRGNRKRSGEMAVVEEILVNTWMADSVRREEFSAEEETGEEASCVSSTDSFGAYLLRGIAMSVADVEYFSPSTCLLRGCSVR